jgi:hypothetical protein
VKNRLDPRALVAAVVLTVATGCASDSPTAPAVDSAAGAPSAIAASKPVSLMPAAVPTGERLVSKNVAIEPAYNADTGDLMYLLTPVKAPLPSHANSHAVSPLYLVEYPYGSTAAGVGGQFNCEGVPGNCPDHDGLVASVAVGAYPGVYGTDPTAVPGHDHVADPPGKPDFNIAWEVVEVVFTDQGMADGAINTRLTTDAQIDAAEAAGDVEKIDLGFAFNCSVVPASLYWKGTPVV